MKRFRWIYCAGLLLTGLWNAPLYAQTRTVTLLKDGWRFARGPQPGAAAPDFDDRNWQSVSIPHDWAIYGPFDKKIDQQVVAIQQNQETRATEKTGRTGALPYIGEGWYRNHFRTPALKPGMTALLLFEGAMSNPEVFVNGRKAGGWHYGYSYFYLDITELIRNKENNLLAVRLNNPGESSRWYPGAGLYRKVSLILKNQESIDQWGVQISTPIATDSFAKINVRTNITVSSGTLVTEIFDAAHHRVAADTSDQLFQQQFEQNLALRDPALWSPETPTLYKAVSSFYQNGVLKDQVTTRFGIRSIRYSAAQGFQLNGKTRKFKGVCLHHDLGPLGAAVNKAALRRQLRILKDMGCDAIRSSHNMPSLEQLELCDEMGFMFLAESFDEWAKPKVKNGYHLYFEKDMVRDVEYLVRATRNHPCIVMWSAGNEVPDQWGYDGAKLARKIQDVFHREDPGRPVTVGMDQVQNAMKYGFGAVLDIPGLNYRLPLYEEAYQTFPQGLLLGSETASTVSSRGVYKFPVVKAAQRQYEDRQCSSYDLEYCSWSNLPDDDFIWQDDKDWVIGEFVWTGFDYLGEPTPYDDQWPSRSSYFGINDLAGLPKDRFYLYRSRWNTREPTLHLLPHWTWPGREGQTTPVFVYTSYDSAELFVNGKSMGIRKKQEGGSPQERYRLMWMDVKYEPGTLRVVALDKEGRPAAETTMETAGSPYAIRLEADRTLLQADGEDISFVTVSIVDRAGRVCPQAAKQLQFSVSGAARYRAACNGDATSLEAFHLPTMQTFNGKLVVLVQAARTAGRAQLKVSGRGLKTAKIGLAIQAPLQQ
ncbi:beta-galactosidase GalB [Niabella terrae]